MMNSTFLKNLLKLDRYSTASQQSRAGLVYFNILAMLGFMTAYFLFAPTATIDGEPVTILTYVTTVGLFARGTIILFVFFIVLSAIFFMTRTGRLLEASIATTAIWFLGGVFAIALLTSLSIGAMALASAVIIAALLLQERGLLVTYVATILTTITVAVIRGENFVEPIEIATFIAQISVMSILIYVFLRFFRQSLSETVSQAVDERVKANELLSDVTKLVADRARSTEIARKVTQSIIDAFDYIYQARLFMLDEANVEAVLMANTTAQNPGTLQLADRVSVGSLSPLGETASSGLPIVTPIEGENSVDVVLPMKIGNRVTGLLNLRTRRLNHFEQPAIIETFNAMADNIALALDNVKQFELAELRVRENDQLVERAQNALREVERLNQRLTGSAWTQFLRSGASLPGLTVDFNNEERLEEDTWTKSLQEAVTINHLIQDVHDDHQVIAVPLRVRGQVIGAMEFELDKNYDFTPEDFELVQDVSERFGLAVENTRLVQESQRVAQREALVNQINARLQSTNEIETALTEAARGLREALKANRVAIKLGEPVEQTPPVSESGGNAS